MIKNELQYRFAKRRVRGLEKTLAELDSRKPPVSPDRKARLARQIQSVKDSLRLYESMKADDFSVERLETAGQLADTLIAARISQGISQKELAQRTGLKEQQIQRYEATDYASASLSRIIHIANSLKARDLEPPAAG